MKVYDIIIVGAGPAGIFAAKELINKGLKVLIIEKGKELSKRKDLICGWFGQGISSIDRFETTDELFKHHSELKDSLKLIKQLSKQRLNKPYYNLSNSTGKSIAKHFYDLVSKDIDIMFDVEVISLIQDGNYFKIKTAPSKELFCKRCIVATGKYSIEWIKQQSDKLNLNCDTKSKYGVRVEVPTFKIKNFDPVSIDNISCSDIHVNSFVGEWEDSGLISSFGTSTIEKSKRTNMLVGIEDDTDNCIRNTKIINVLTNDKVKKERVKEFIEGKSILHNLDSFKKLILMFEKLEESITDFSECSFMYVPEIKLSGILNVDENMCTNVNHLYGIGECTNKVSNTIGAMASGILVAKKIIEEI